MGSNGVQAAAGAAPAPPAEARPESDGAPPFVSLVERCFGGKMETGYTCCNCQAVSVHKETFTEIQLAVPTEQPETAKSVQHLLYEYLEEEKLQDDNQYHCDRCAGLQVRAFYFSDFTGGG